MRRSTKFAAALTAGILSLALTACGGSSDDNGSAKESTGSSGAKSDIKVGLAYDIGGRGDQSFNDMAAAGLDKAKSEFGVKASESEATPDEAESAKEDRLIQLADGGYNPVIAIGFAYSEAVGKVAKQFPDTNFAIVDDTANTDANVTNLVFAEEQGSFLVGAAAALKSKTGDIGFVGGVNVPLINKFEAGYDAGAKAVNPNIKIESAYLTQPPDFTGFNDPGKGKTAAEGQFDGGADVVYHAAGGSGLGVFQAAKAAKGLAIGVDSDQYLTAAPDLQPSILTSMIKHVDVAVYNFIKSFKDGDPLTGTVTFDLKSGGVDYSTSGGQVDDIKSKLDDFKKQIIDGTITVPTTVK
ncbi:nucleoside-binding protein [Nocardioides terrae]|uniref:Nucleoside-binding protein n=1 Tax=Nocardioides terrae TaxID=574651 RepID=A0A1I1LLZ5_9ACTN|nr:BMP family ABC transporter substrate-binding protein [Nocardioides terrae]SFC73966.1 nucleoside-binding protein [Nocardioides terrae]